MDGDFSSAAEEISASMLRLRMFICHKSSLNLILSIEKRVQVEVERHPFGPVHDAGPNPHPVTL
jgi:hypothetical protein